MMMKEMTSNMNYDLNDFYGYFKHFMRFFTLEQRFDGQSDGLAL